MKENVRCKSIEQMNIPKEIIIIAKRLADAGFEAYPVGGCVRDMLISREPDDWDITTNATPEEIQKLFPDSFYANAFLTVTVKTESSNSRLKHVEITTFRQEGGYSDKRHPDEVKPAKTLEEDLARRDFTVNAMALKIQNAKIKSQNDNSKFKNYDVIDPYNGSADLDAKLIRAVGKPEERFEEDALRMMRAVRIAGKLEFLIEEKTADAIKKHAGLLRVIAKERVRDEFVKIIEEKNPKTAIEMLLEMKLLAHIIPELEEGIGMEQRGPHKYTIYEHNLRAVQYAADQNYPLRTRLAALFHDIAKPRTREKREGIWTFYGHDVVGAKMTYQILTRIRMSAEEAKAIANLVRWHLFSYKLRRDAQYQKDLAAMGDDPAAKDIEDSEEDMQETSDAAIRRLISRAGREEIHDLVQVRICDRIATGVPKAAPYRLRHFQFRVEKILREGEATNVKMLAVRGEDVMGELGIPQSPRVGHILNALLEEVLDEPQKNTKDTLIARMRELNAFSDEELLALREKAQEKVAGMEEDRVAEIKKKYHVK